MQEGEKQGIFVEISEKIIEKASLEPSKNIQLVFIRLVSQWLCHHVSIPNGVIKPINTP